LAALWNYLVYPHPVRICPSRLTGDFQPCFITVILGVLAAVVNTTLIRRMSFFIRERRGVNLSTPAAQSFPCSFSHVRIVGVFIRSLNDLFHISESNILINRLRSVSYTLSALRNQAVFERPAKFFSLCLK